MNRESILINVIPSNGAQKFVAPSSPEGRRGRLRNRLAEDDLLLAVLVPTGLQVRPGGRSLVDDGEQVTTMAQRGRLPLSVPVPRQESTDLDIDSSSTGGRARQSRFGHDASCNFPYSTTSGALELSILLFGEKVKLTEIQKIATLNTFLTYKIIIIYSLCS